MYYCNMFYFSFSDPIHLLLLAIIFVLLIISAGVIWYCLSINKKFDEILEKGNIKDFKDIFVSQKEKNDSLVLQLAEAFLRIEALEEIAKKSFQKSAIVKFNPFNETGGNQSFVIALLDKEDNGLVISSLFVHEGNRVYTKAIKNGKSAILLSQEEMEAVEKAINTKPHAKTKKAK